MVRMTGMLRTYSELSQIELFEDRFRYLMLRGGVGHATFGHDRYINQLFYTSQEWKKVRNQIIVRDNGCDLGVAGFDIHDRLLIHHMNPMSVGDIVHGDESILDPEYLITTTHRTHNAIHYGDERLLQKPYTPRKMGDTRLW